MTALSIHLTVPANNLYEDLVLRAVEIAANATREEAVSLAPPAAQPPDPFTAELVSAIAVLVNNVSRQQGQRAAEGTIEIHLTPRPGCLKVELRESGASLDLRDADPDLEWSPERGKRMYIVRSFVDELRYQPGAPNTWWLLKYRADARR
jgi:anti-sigma regulatory factor (Ser/Thr protein kinase)